MNITLHKRLYTGEAPKSYLFPEFIDMIERFPACARVLTYDNVGAYVKNSIGIWHLDSDNVTVCYKSKTRYVNTLDNHTLHETVEISLHGPDDSVAKIKSRLRKKLRPQPRVVK